MIFTHAGSGDVFTSTITVDPPDCELTMSYDGRISTCTLTGNKFKATMRENPQAMETITITAKKSGYQDAACYLTIYSLDYTPFSINDDRQPFIDELVRRINQKRAANGLAELKNSSLLNEAAAIRSKEMTKSNRDVRYGQNRSWTTAMDDVGFSYKSARYVAFNPTYLQQFMNVLEKNDISETMLSPEFDCVGIGIERSPNMGNATVWTAIYAKESEEGGRKTIEPYIELDKTDITLKVGESMMLNVSVYPTGAAYGERFIWSPDDKSIVQASGSPKMGHIKALSPGATYVWVISEKSGLTAGCYVRVEADVTESEPPYIELGSKKIKMYAGNSYQFHPKIVPASRAQGNEFIYEISGSAAEYTGNGLVYALEPGIAYLTVTSSKYPEISATCEINIHPAEEQED